MGANTKCMHLYSLINVFNIMSTFKKILNYIVLLFSNETIIFRNLREEARTLTIYFICLNQSKCQVYEVAPFSVHVLNIPKFFNILKGCCFFIFRLNNNFHKNFIGNKGFNSKFYWFKRGWWWSVCICAV